eukprot:TRINITY_DN14966_c0_g1_i1.p1 TRINITY_DN14966_c0_g1~~TRINITY_DN14966_c0_g1_i1.p1  ORF type:complete len:809 (+),score=98.79 TRINITY_DN14966_c0_g1_i1:128-2554(+)
MQRSRYEAVGRQVLLDFMLEVASEEGFTLLSEENGYTIYEKLNVNRAIETVKIEGVVPATRETLFQCLTYPVPLWDIQLREATVLETVNENTDLVFLSVFPDCLPNNMIESALLWTRHEQRDGTLYFCGRTVTHDAAVFSECAARIHVKLIGYCAIPMEPGQYFLRFVAMTNSESMFRLELNPVIRSAYAVMASTNRFTFLHSWLTEAHNESTAQQQAGREASRRALRGLLEAFAGRKEDGFVKVAESDDVAITMRSGAEGQCTLCTKGSFMVECPSSIAFDVFKEVSRRPEYDVSCLQSCLIRRLDCDTRQINRMVFALTPLNICEVITLQSCTIGPRGTFSIVFHSIDDPDHMIPSPGTVRGTMPPSGFLIHPVERSTRVSWVFQFVLANTPIHDFVQPHLTATLASLVKMRDTLRAQFMGTEAVDASVGVNISCPGAVPSTVVGQDQTGLPMTIPLGQLGDVTLGALASVYHENEVLQYRLIEAEHQLEALTRLMERRRHEGEDPHMEPEWKPEGEATGDMLALLTNVARKFVSCRDEDSFGCVLEEALESLFEGVDCAVTYLYSEEHGTLRLLRGKSLRDNGCEYMELRRDPEWVVQHRSMLIMNDPGSVSSPSLGTKSRLCVPLECNRTILGTIGLASSRPSFFTSHHISVVSFLAQLASIALQNVRLRLLNHTPSPARQAPPDLLPPASSPNLLDLVTTMATVARKAMAQGGLLSSTDTERSRYLAQNIYKQAGILVTKDGFHYGQNCSSLPRTGYPPHPGGSHQMISVYVSTINNTNTNTNNHLAEIRSKNCTWDNSALEL